MMRAKAKLFFACSALSFWKTVLNCPLTSPTTTLHALVSCKTTTAGQTYIFEAIMDGYVGYDELPTRWC